MQGANDSTWRFMRAPVKDPKQTRLIALDGAGYDDANGKHHYVLLAASTGEVLVGGPEGLTSVECLEFLVRLRMAHPDGKFFGYGFKYDAEMILRELPVTVRQDLIDQRKFPVKWDNYGIKYLPGQLLQISAHHLLKPNNTHPCIQIYDVQAWFGVNSADSIRQWLDVELSYDEYSWDSFDQLPDMIAAAREKLPLLVELMYLIWDDAEALGGVQGRIHGPAALAGSWLRAHKVKDHLYGDEPPEVTQAIRRAFHGPRMQSYHVGTHHGLVTDCDIRSAFAAAYTALPSLAWGHWEHINGRPDEYVEFALYYVELDEMELPQYPPPLPQRNMDTNRSDWTHWAKGWHWGPRAKLVWHNKRARIKEAWVYREGGPRPFRWVPDLYERRKESPLRDHIVKQSLARIWGKLAQQRGYEYTQSGLLVTPPYHCLAFAGFVTAYVDAILYQGMCLAVDAGHELLGCAIDGFQHTGSAVLVPKDELGGWKTIEYAGGTFLGITQYWLVAADGTVAKARTRGMVREGLDVPGILQQLNGLEKYDFGIGATDDLAHIYVHECRFIGQGVGMNDPKQWRTWVEKRIVIPFGRAPGGEAWHDPLYCEGCRPYLPPSDILHRMFLVNIEYEFVDDSAPYLMRWERDRLPDPANDDEVIT